MIVPRSLARLSLATALLLAAGGAPSFAFSQIGRQDGTVADQDGVIAAPLPPLEAPKAPPPATQPPASDAAANAPAPAQTDGAAAPIAPSAPAPTAPTPPAAPATPPVAPDATGTPAEPPVAPGAQKEEGTDPAASQAAVPSPPAGPPPDVVYGDAGLPAPVRDLRAKLMEIAKSGEIDKLRPYIEPGEDGTVLSFGGIDGDPIDYLKAASGDGDGVEVLAILLELLESGHIRSEPGTENEIYVWPYFAGLPIDKLTKPQKVQLFELVTAGDYQEMLGFGAYNFYRVGISPDGKLQFFVAGD
ncbi:hypothetical protein GCM10011390_42410 [Aureimonas endophytica]|uniref:Uncharacterized protein n=1 Tax=Aureimonas endophytica TaxID=2027858 RepID=A0A916ZY13_9HYPH|nr:hypothetical protein [Aureimonas endophytica]GGE18748.1 hypothetical protein GCM10011390_42410 [Aureimonas endophytica]